ncbi:hypothetical protein K469DRAFT_649183 [Zopfia rhizophila CBS 207.26]|uniref:Transcriptional regulator n=1 Tax=Zopfia rhizophila CBS 207.26 TaxID=1314779 RepID=A0A6A6EYX7_9PEZI|nr:hypothetical protein K469DRAFT_649183 [Zopfia rhizophila CBS 207.26]
MSDSEGADIPPAAAITRAIRDAVIGIYKSGKIEDLTVKRVRARVEEELGLPAEFLKTSSEWKQKSHDIIHEAVQKHCSDEQEPEPESKPPKRAKAAKPKPAPKKTKADSGSPRGVKRRPAPPAEKPQKRRKTAVSSNEEPDVARSECPVKNDPFLDEESPPPKKLVRRTKKVVEEDSDEEVGGAPEERTHKKSRHDDEGSGEEPKVAAPAEEPDVKITANVTGNVSESELSSLIDETPVKKKLQKKSPSEKRGKEPKKKESAKRKVKTSKPKGAQNADPDEAEIKRLQSWLVKCGIRKVWSKELARCDTSKEKIKHLKGMLNDVGMEGKYSNEKAARIKEQREFAADLEAIQEGEKKWGNVNAGDDGERPRQRLARGIKNMTIIRDDEDEDEDENEDKDEVKERNEEDVDDGGDSDSDSD